MATEINVTSLPVYSDPATLVGKSVVVHDTNTGDPVRFDASRLVVPAKDLSMYTTEGHSLVLRETANSYVVRTPGFFKFPVVYGNGIKAGIVNAAAYTSLGLSNQADFVNHLGNKIESPWIEKNANCQPASAALLWQTAKGMITSVSIEAEGEGSFIHFTVDQVPATNGLALLVVKNAAGVIMWSWMIWLTSDTLGPEKFTNYTGVEYLFMSENLGAIWNDARTRQYNTHFQWGRKDPGAPVNGNGAQATLYDINGNVYSGWGVLGADNDSLADKTVANAIKNPNLFFTRFDATSNNWNNLARFNNFWNAAINADGVNDDQASAIKTIYDPCPVGWMLPAGRAFTGFTAMGGNIEDSTKFNIIGSWDAGFRFKRTPNDTIGNYFPASGYRILGSGSLSYIGSYGCWWSFASNSQAYARSLDFHSGGVSPLSADRRAYGFSVRPVRELN